jgi:hypothetical protein
VGEFVNEGGFLLAVRRQEVSVIRGERDSLDFTLRQLPGLGGLTASDSVLCGSCSICSS